MLFEVVIIGAVEVAQLTSTPEELSSILGATKWKESTNPQVSFSVYMCMLVYIPMHLHIKDRGQCWVSFSVILHFLF